MDKEFKHEISIGKGEFRTNAHISLLMRYDGEKRFLCINTADYDTLDSDNDQMVQPMQSLEDFLQLGFADEDFKSACSLNIGETIKIDCYYDGVYIMRIA